MTNPFLIPYRVHYMYFALSLTSGNWSLGTLDVNLTASDIEIEVPPLGWTESQQVTISLGPGAFIALWQLLSGGGTTQTSIDGYFVVTLGGVYSNTINYTQAGISTTLSL